MEKDKMWESGENKLNEGYQSMATGQEDNKFDVNSEDGNGNHRTRVMEGDESGDDDTYWRDGHGSSE